MPDNKLGADGLVPSPTMLENGHTFGAYEVVETELIMRNKLARGAYGPPPMVSEVGPALWLRATTAQRDAMLAEIMAIGKDDLHYLPPHHVPHTHAEAWLLKKNPHSTPNTCPACAVNTFKAKIKGRFGNGQNL